MWKAEQPSDSSLNLKIVQALPLPCPASDEQCRPPATPQVSSLPSPACSPRVAVPKVAYIAFSICTPVLASSVEGSPAWSVSLWLQPFLCVRAAQGMLDEHCHTRRILALPLTPEGHAGLCVQQWAVVMIRACRDMSSRACSIVAVAMPCTFFSGS